MNTCVYFHINPFNNEIFYVGIGDIKRPYEKGKGRRNEYWNNVVNKYGNPVIKIIHENLSWEEACELEIKYIKEIGRRDLGLGTLVNFTDGGDGMTGHICSDITKQRIRETKIGNKNPMFGKMLSEEVKIKLSLAANA